MKKMNFLIYCFFLFKEMKPELLFTSQSYVSSSDLFDCVCVCFGQYLWVKVIDFFCFMIDLFFQI